MATLDVGKMSKIERLRIMEAIWNSLLHDESGIESPNWHENVCKKEKERLNRENPNFFLWRK
ncbi:MAG TPA: cysteine methyltransferase [Methylothermaceae bacterium]|nr:cysteine methyltransferase [Methylothermaceae bacterium]